MTGRTDDLSALVVAAQRGDERAFESLVRATHAETYTLAFRLTGDDEDARDVTQDTYLRAYRALDRFRGDAQFQTWLYRITANSASTLLGQRARHRHDELTEEAPVADDRITIDPVARAEGDSLRHHLTDALRRLPAGPAVRRGAARRLRPAPRRHRRGAGHLGHGGQGAPPPGPPPPA